MIQGNIMRGQPPVIRKGLQQMKTVDACCFTTNEDVKVGSFREMSIQFGEQGLHAYLIVRKGEDGLSKVAVGRIGRHGIRFSTDVNANKQRCVIGLS